MGRILISARIICDINRGGKMAGHDIGIDLGTSSVIIYNEKFEEILNEPSVVAFNNRTGDILAVGEEAALMVGKTPAYISAVMPLEDGVISDYEITEQMLRYFVNKVTKARMVKPRIAICVPSLITDVEARSVLDSALAIGARKVYLIEEPIAAAIGADIDITLPHGRMIVDIGAGTCDVAVISLGNIVYSRSAKVAGNKLNNDIVTAVRKNHRLLIGPRMAEKIKIAIADINNPESELVFEAKGRDLQSGIPRKQMVSAELINEAIEDSVQEIIRTVHAVVENISPELLSDIYIDGIMLTGGGALLRGLDKRLESALKTKVRIADDPLKCVAIGMAKSFYLIDKLGDGFRQMSIMGRK